MNTDFDLDANLASYEGDNFLRRLFFIAENYPEFTNEAGNMLKISLSNSTNIYYLNRYQSLYGEMIRIEAEEKYVQELENAQMELRHYRSSMIKESIRIGQMQVAEVFHKYGQYEEALKSYSAVREVCTTSHHVYDLTLKLLDVYLNLSNFSGITILISRAKSSASKLSEQELGIFDIYLALSYFGLGDFKNAANVLLSLKLSTFETNGQSEMLPLIPCDVAILGTLSALASFSREDVFQRTIQNSEFQKFLETQNEMKDLIEMYKYAKLNAFFDFLNGKLFNVYKFDVFMNPQLSNIYSTIKENVILEFIKIFDCVSIEYLAKSFMSEKNELLERLVYLINEHNLPIMIDEKEMKVLFDEKASKKKVDIVCNEMDSKLTSLEQFYKSNQIKNI